MRSSSVKIPKIEQEVPLADYTTFGIGGAAKYFAKATDVEELAALSRWAKEQGEPVFILGRGSNTLFDDRGYNGLVVLNRLDFVSHDKEKIECGAGYNFSLLGVQTARAGYAGLEFASGIPGSVGGAVFMNAGANGQETADVLHDVTAISPDGEVVKLPKSELHFAYRTSSFQTNGCYIAAATFLLTPEEGARQRQIQIVLRRKATQPLKEKSAGCIFRNPTDCSAGALIEQASLKGHTVGNAQVSDVHANFLINRGGARASDILQLIREVKEKVAAVHGVTLQDEVWYVPFEK